MILIIDNYDSFTYNLVQYFGELGEEVVVKRNNRVTLHDISQMNPEVIVLSPGPGHPNDAGICIPVIKAFHKMYPILGICLGHQAIGAAFGASITQAKSVKHGKQSEASHLGTGIFESIKIPATVMRYHSLVIDRDTLPKEFEILATSLDDLEIMAMKHHRYPLYGLQFHPESIGTPNGRSILKNFLKEIREEKRRDESVFKKASRR